MKWAKRIAIVILLAVVAIAIYAVATAHRSARPVGFQVARVEAPDGPLAVALWYPTSATPRPTTFVAGTLMDVAKNGPVKGDRLPVVLVSHGNGGSALSHVDLAMALASAGYVVAAPTHPGDNYADPGRQGSPALFSQRAAQVRAVGDYVLTRWPASARVDPTRIGAFGFSAGAFTVLTLVGGRPDLGRIAERCRRAPEFICKAFAQARSPLLRDALQAGRFQPDPRIRAAVVAAPGLGFTFAGGGLAGVTVPVQVWSGDRDDTVPFASNTGIVLEGLGAHAQSRRLPGASHVSFLAPCGLLRPPAVCRDPQGFDRERAHAAMNAEVVRFFDRQLARTPATR